MLFNRLKWLPLALAGLLVGGLVAPANAVVITISTAQTTETPVYSNVWNYQFRIELAGSITPGGVYNNPALVGVDYFVRGDLATGTPSGFPRFSLVRSIGGAEFYAQGSSLSFAVSPGAFLPDGLQISELSGAGVVFDLNAREVNTGRYHPPMFRLSHDGTGILRNSNNTGGTNPVTQQVVDVDFGEEYITNLAFDPASTTITPPIPIPAGGLLLGSALVAVVFVVRRRGGNQNHFAHCTGASERPGRRFAP